MFEVKKKKVCSPTVCGFQVLVAEIEQKQSKIDECQKTAEQCSSAMKVNHRIHCT